MNRLFLMLGIAIGAVIGRKRSNDVVIRAGDVTPGQLKNWMRANHQVIRRIVDLERGLNPPRLVARDQVSRLREAGL